MAEKIVSPGVFTKEIDASFLPAAIGEIGAAVVGPTIKGPAMVPTVVSSYAEFQQTFGDTFRSGSNTYQFLTSVTAQNYLKNGNKLTVVRILDGSFSGAKAAVMSSGSAGISFQLNTIAHGDTMNNAGVTSSNAVLPSGSVDNVRWEISSLNVSKGTFTLSIRRGNDRQTQKVALETWNDLSLDPNSNNYIARKIGDQYAEFAGTAADPYVNYNGNYPQKSKYVYVSDINNTPNYLDENSSYAVEYTASLPSVGSGSLNGAFASGSVGYSGLDSLGNITGTYGNHITASFNKAYDFFDAIGTFNSQGFELSSGTTDDGGSSYMEALGLLSNADEYDINLLMIPGIIDAAGSGHTAIITKAVDICESRGDCFLLYDTVKKSETNIANVTTKAKSRDTNYGATYWPWVQIQDIQTGAMRWVPPSCVMGGIYAFNDKVAAPWFAPAGLNRGGLTTVVQAARKLTHGNRDDLYESNVNPLATFPGQGVVVWGQKTLQKKSSALDRVNVRRLLIKVKKFISASSRFLVFEQNNTQTRERFLNIANPFLEQVQSQSGLNAFKVVMDASNNTPDVVDRNILYGQLFLQPTKTAEFIVLDFTVQPTGAAFPE